MISLTIRPGDSLDKDYTFTTTNPLIENWPEQKTEVLTSANIFVNFEGIKIGDLNGDATPDYDPTLQNRYDGSLNLQIQDADLTAGNEYTVDFKAKDFNQVFGYQFTLAFDVNTLEYAGLSSGSIEVSENNFGFSRLSDGFLTTSWDDIDGVSLDDDEVLFSITFRALSDVKLSKTLRATSQRTKAEAYSAIGGTMGVAIEFSGNNSNGTTTEFVLYQNTPNPFNGSTTIGFNLPTAGLASLSIYDISGKRLFVVNETFTKGYNEVEIESAELASAGVLYYELVFDDFKATKKMIVIE